MSIVGCGGKSTAEPPGTRRNVPHHPPAGDPRRAYLDALARIPDLDRVVQAAGVDVLAGRITSEAYDQVERALRGGHREVTFAQSDAAEFGLYLLRALAGCEPLRHAGMLALVRVCRPELAAVADRLDALTERVKDLEAALAEATA